MNRTLKRRRGARSTLMLGATLLAFACLLAGCAGVHGWLTKSGDGPVTGGARVSVPLGGK